MRKTTLAAIAVLGISLSGCAGIQNAYNIVTGATVTPGTAYVAAEAFDAIEGTATNYLKLPACTGAGNQLCRTQAAVNQIVPAIRSGRTARNNLEAAVTASNGAPVNATLLQALQAQTSTLQAIMANYNIK